MVSGVEYFMSESLSLGIYDSCKNVYSPSLQNYAFSVLCGAWGVDLCNPKRLFDYLGDVNNNPYVPFNVSIIDTILIRHKRKLLKWNLIYLD